MNLFIATPTHDGRLTGSYVDGLVEAMREFAGGVRYRRLCGSYLPRQRNQLTREFLASPCTHMMCIDSDIGWRAADVRALIAAGVDAVSGCYVRRDETQTVPAELVPGQSPKDVLECSLVSAGFLLLSREALERMRDEFGGALWCGSWNLDRNEDLPEDYSFCERWRSLGGRLWLHRGVRLRHMGEKAFEVPA